ncbi:MAG TPA: hypothetical protein EYQ50_24540, partial [Verrucomicrobiales bacterium]|nr:hypothetical protein [Verrucomicrobiales bacterium]
MMRLKRTSRKSLPVVVGRRTRIGSLSSALLLVVSMAGSVGAVEHEWVDEGHYKWKNLDVPDTHQVGFELLSGERTGIPFQNRVTEERSLRNRVLLSGSGVAAADVDGDGWCDLYFCRLDGSNVLYRNLGNWKFESITDLSPGIDLHDSDSTAAVFADVDGDHDMDLLVNLLGGGTRLFENNGSGRFKDVTVSSGLSSEAASMSMALADIDLDGDIDLYVTNYRDETMMDQPKTRYRIGQDQNGRSIVTHVNGRSTDQPEYKNRFRVSPSGNVFEFGESDFLFINDGQGVFESQSWTSGRFLDVRKQVLREAPMDWGLAVQFHDVNDDGLPDLYVCNDLFTPDRFWINVGGGRFSELDPLSIRNFPTYSMGVDFSDVDRDGDVDVFVTDMLSPDPRNQLTQVGQKAPVYWPIGRVSHRPQVKRNTLQVNRGDGTFAEASFFAALEASDWSWGPVFLDVDLDGFEDLLIPNGQMHDIQNADIDRQIKSIQASGQLTMEEILKLIRLYPRLDTPNLLFRNSGDLHFEEIGAQWGFSESGISQGLALADLDNDGDLDVVVNNLNATAGLYRNVADRNRIAVSLISDSANTRGVGAKIKLDGSDVLQIQELIAGGRYLSGDQPLTVFAAASIGKTSSLEVDWPSGRRSVLKGVQGNRWYEIHEPSMNDSENRRLPKKKDADPFFVDRSAKLKHRHVETPFDDFRRQSLLPRRYSQSGPGVVWTDVNHDHWEDLVIGSGRGGAIAVYINDKKGGFKRQKDSRPLPYDLAGMLSLRDSSSSNKLLAVARYDEMDRYPRPFARIYDFESQEVATYLPSLDHEVGSISAADIDGDHDLDLFVGGSFKSGQFPSPVSSYIYVWEDGRLKHSREFKQLGRVSGSVFTDLNQDGQPDLAIACDWGRVRVFINDKGNFVERTEDYGLSSFRGWWTGITAGDLDADGRMDLIVGNWGLNHEYRAQRDSVRKLYYGDLDENGSFDLVETWFSPALNREMPQRDYRSVLKAFPFLFKKNLRFQDFANLAIEQIFGPELWKLKTLEVDTMASMVFFNRGNRFKPIEMPREAQMAPVFGVSVADYDGDGFEDLFLSQNFFAMNPETSRIDA